MTLPDPVKMQDIDSPQMDPRDKVSFPSSDVDTAVRTIAANAACIVAALAVAAGDAAAVAILRISSSRESNRDSPRWSPHFVSHSSST